eukprot:4084362-Alexandrium_andersonii.AAC.1
MTLNDKMRAMDTYVRNIGWYSEYSHLDPAGANADTSRTYIGVFKSKYSRDAFLWEARNNGFYCHSLRIMARPQ